MNAVEVPAADVWDSSLPGKLVGEHLYIHNSAIDTLPFVFQERIERAAELAAVVADRDYNVVKLHKNGEDLSFLSYPGFYELGFPILAKSWRVSLAREMVVFRTYEESCNPPILHRKELMLLPNDPGIPAFQALTAAAEALGLFNDQTRIGTREYWFGLLSERGYELAGHELIPLANDQSSSEDPVPEGPGIQRHLTALSRGNFSAPVQALWRHGLISDTRTFFDYGCGKGDDIRGLVANGIDATGWDPHFANDKQKRIADTVNLGFVINVIEDLAERIEALRGAYDCTGGVLSVAAMLSSQTPPDGRPYRDGYLSSRKTFQKYYAQSQLRDFIEETLDEPAIAAGPGVFFVFRDKTLEQRFLSSRYGRHGKNLLNRGWTYERIRREARIPRPRRVAAPKVSREDQIFDSFHDTFLATWLLTVELGRAPDWEELPHDLQLRVEENIGSLGKVSRINLRRFNLEDLERSAAQKRTNLLVFAALQQFQRRKPYKQLDATLQRDVKHFFGDYTSLLGAAKRVLYDVANPSMLDAACKEAFEKGYGWMEESHSLQVHSSLLERLPALLRVYVGCATAIYGDATDFDLIKIHIRSGKITLMKFDDFVGSPLPRLVKRIKVKLRELDMDVYDYENGFDPPLLYFKSRFVNEEFPHFEEQVLFEEQLACLGLHDLRGYGPSTTDFYQVLSDARWAIQGFSLVRSSSTPHLDDPCGTHFKFRHLIECGDTQQRTATPNVPKEAASYTALYDLATNILDPVIEYFGMIELSYGFCSSALAKEIKGRIAPHLDQHAAHEMNSRGNPICDRLGAACDFIVKDENMEEVARWVIQNTPVDRLYFYGDDRPIHVSYSPQPMGQFIRFKTKKGKGLIPVVDRELSRLRKSAPS